MVDVTDATFETEVIAKSQQVPVVVDLWAPWCGPCKQLGPLLENATAATNGQVILAKINVDENPAVSQAFQVQSIPAVHAFKGGEVVDSFVGGQSEQFVNDFVGRLAPGAAAPSEVDQLVAAGDEVSLRKALELEPGHAEATTALAGLMVSSGRNEDGLALLGTIPESPETRRIAALARAGDGATDDVEAKLQALLPRVKGDDDARQEFIDILELLGPNDPRTADWRKKLTTTLF